MTPRERLDIFTQGLHGKRSKGGTKLSENQLFNFLVVPKGTESSCFVYQSKGFEQVRGREQLL